MTPTTITTTNRKLHPEMVNNLDRNAIIAIKNKMKNDPTFGGKANVSLSATWKEGVVTSSAHPSLVCYPPPELQLSSEKKGPTIYSYCPLISGSCFSLIMMMRAAEKRYAFESMTTTMTTNADVLGYYKPDWVDKKKRVRHPWGKGIKLDIYVQSSKSQEKLEALAHYSEDHCPSSEIMKRDFPVSVDTFVNAKKDVIRGIDWENNVPVYYDMEKYQELSEQTKMPMKQVANMVWHCQNENKEFPDSLMSFEFPHDQGSRMVLSHDKPISSGKYASPMEGCFFGGLASYLHMIAARIYAHGYKVQSIQGKLETVMNKRKVMGVEKGDHKFVFPRGASVEISMISNLPEDLITKVYVEAENMSPTFMNWTSDLPLEYEVHRLEPCAGQHLQQKLSRSDSPKSIAQNLSSPSKDKRIHSFTEIHRSSQTVCSDDQSTSNESSEENRVAPPMLSGPGRVFKKWFGGGKKH